MHISQKGINLITQFEGFSPTQYNDGTGVMTIGYGTTASDISPLPQHMTQQEAIHFLVEKLHQKYEPAVNNLGIQLNQNQFDALVSFDYNLGPGIFSGTSIGNLLRSHQLKAAADDMLQYDHAGGQVMLGLQRRRQAERALFLEPAAPVDVFHYELFATSVTPFEHTRIVERQVVIKYDQLRQHPWMNYWHLKPLKKQCFYLADQIAKAAFRDKDHNGHANWNKYERGWRYHQLRVRGAGKKVTSA